MSVNSLAITAENSAFNSPYRAAPSAVPSEYTPADTKTNPPTEMRAATSTPTPNFDATQDDEKTIKIDEKLDGIYTVIGEGDTVSGNLSGRRGVRVSGTVKGNVEAKNGSVIVDAGAVIEGNVVASGRIICFGTIGVEDETKASTVTIACPGIVVTAGEGKIHGDVYYGKLLTAGDPSKSFIEGYTRPYAKFSKDKTLAGKI